MRSLLVMVVIATCSQAAPLPLPRPMSSIPVGSWIMVYDGIYYDVVIEVGGGYVAEAWESKQVYVGAWRFDRVRGAVIIEKCVENPGAEWITWSAKFTKYGDGYTSGKISLIKPSCRK